MITGAGMPSIPEHPPYDPRVPRIPAVLRKRLLAPECVRRRAVAQLQQQRGADVVGAVGRADRPAEDEAAAVRREIGFVRVQMRPEELRRAGLRPRAEELLQALAGVV